jgi:cation transport protein ChaC
VRLESGHEREAVPALTYLVDRQHEQYAGVLSREEVLRYVRDGVGRSGINSDYVINTAKHLASLGIEDPVLAWLGKELAVG